MEFEKKICSTSLWKNPPPWKRRPQWHGPFRRSLSLRKLLFLHRGPLWWNWSWGWFLHFQNSFDICKLIYLEHTSLSFYIRLSEVAGAGAVSTKALEVRITFPPSLPPHLEKEGETWYNIVSKAVKVELGPIFWVWEVTISRRINIYIIENRVSCEGEGLHQ